MKKSILLCFAFMAYIKSGTAQDLLIKNNGDTVRAKILEVSDEVIRYKRTNNLEGPTFVTNKWELNKVVYANGTEEKITAKPPAQIQAEEKPAKAVEPNIDVRIDRSAAEKNSQSDPADEYEPIQIERNTYYYKGRRLNDVRLKYLYKNFNDPSILKEYNGAKGTNLASKITGVASIPFGVSGILMVIISQLPDLADEQTSGKPNENLLGPGLALVGGFIGLQVTSIVLKSAYKAKIRKTITHYNNVVAKHDLK